MDNASELFNVLQMPKECGVNVPSDTHNMLELKNSCVYLLCEETLNSNNFCKTDYNNSEITPKSDVTVYLSSNVLNSLEFEDNFKYSSNMETTNICGYHGTENNTYSQDCGFPGFNHSAVLSSEPHTKYEYFSQFNRKANRNFLESYNEEQDSIDGVDFYLCETENDMVSSRQSDESVLSSQQSEYYLNVCEGNRYTLNSSSLKYAAYNDMNETGRMGDMFSRNNVAMNAIECNENFYISNILNVCDLDSEPASLNDYVVSYNLDSVCNENRNGIRYIVDNDHCIFDMWKSSDQESISASENLYENCDFDLQNSTVEMGFGKENPFLFEVSRDEKTVVMFNFEDEPNYIERTEIIDVNETETYMYELSTDSLNSYAGSGGSEYNSGMNLNYGFNEPVEVYDSNLYFQGWQTIDEETSSSSYNRWEPKSKAKNQKQPKEEVKAPGIVKIQETKHQQYVNNIRPTKNLGEGYDHLGIALDKNNLKLEINAECNPSENSSKNIVNLKEYETNYKKKTQRKRIHVRKTKRVKRISKQYLKIKTVAHNNIKPTECPIKKSIYGNWMDLMKLTKPCFVRLDVLQENQKFKVRCLIHNKYKCKCICGNKVSIKRSSLCCKKKKVTRSRKKKFRSRIIKNNALQWKYKKKVMESLNYENSKFSVDNNEVVTVSVYNHNRTAQSISDDNFAGWCKFNLKRILKSGKCDMCYKCNKFDDICCGVNCDTDSHQSIINSSLCEAVCICKMSSEIFSAGHEESDYHLVKNVNAERINKNESKSKEDESNIKNLGDNVNNIDEICSADNNLSFPPNAVVENVHENSDRHDNEHNMKTDYSRTSEEVSMPGSFEEVRNMEDEGDVEVVLAHQSKENTEIRDVEFEDVLIITEPPGFIKINPVIKIEDDSDISENDKLASEQNNKTGLFDLSEFLDSDFEEYTESLDGLSDNSDEEVEIENDLVVHKPLKDFADSIVLPLSKELFNKPCEANLEGHEPKPVLICSTPGIGYLDVIEHDKEKIVIEDPVDAKLRHQFSNNGHASNWLNRFFHHYMTFDHGVNMMWPFLHHSISEKAYHFNPEILKDMKVIVTKNGVEKLPIIDPKELKRFHYRRKLEKYGIKLANFVTLDDVSTIPLISLLKKAVKVIKKESATHLKLEYQRELLSRFSIRQKAKLKATLTGNENRKSQRNECSCGASKLREGGERFLPTSSETANSPEENNVSNVTLQLSNHNHVLPSTIVSAQNEETCTCDSPENSTMFLPCLNTSDLHCRGTVNDDEIEIHHSKQVCDENLRGECVKERMCKIGNSTLMKGCFSKDGLIRVNHHGNSSAEIGANKLAHNLQDNAKRKLREANIKKIGAWQAKQKQQTSSYVPQALSADGIRCNPDKPNLKRKIHVLEADQLHTAKPAAQGLSIDHIRFRQTNYEANLQKIKTWLANRMRAGSLNISNPK